MNDVDVGELQDRLISAKEALATQAAMIETLANRKTRVFIVVSAGLVSAVYSDNAKVGVEIVDQDSHHTYEEHLANLAREDEIAGEMVSVL